MSSSASSDCVPLSELSKLMRSKTLRMPTTCASVTNASPSTPHSAALASTFASHFFSCLSSRIILVLSSNATEITPISTVGRMKPPITMTKRKNATASHPLPLESSGSQRRFVVGKPCRSSYR